MASFNCVIATAGRKSLKKAVQSILPQLNENDYLTIIFDGCPVDEKVYAGARCKVDVYYEPKALGHWGHGARNKYQNTLPGDYIFNGDDDDMWAPSAMEKIRKHCTEKKMYVFQFMFNQSRFPRPPWRTGVGRVGTPNGVYANIGDFPEWVPIYGGDGMFYEKLAEKLEVEWIEEVIYIVRPKKGDMLNAEIPSGCIKCHCASFFTEERTNAMVFLCRSCGHAHYIKKKHLNQTK